MQWAEAFVAKLPSCRLFQRTRLPHRRSLRWETWCGRRKSNRQSPFEPCRFSNRPRLSAPRMQCEPVPGLRSDYPFTLPPDELGLSSPAPGNCVRPVGLANTRTLLAHCLVENAVVHTAIVEWAADRPSVVNPARSFLSVTPPMRCLDIVWMIVSPRSSHAFRVPVVRNNVVVICELFVADSA